MEKITTFSGFEIQISHIQDGDMRNSNIHPEIIRPYPQVHGTIIREYRGNNQSEFSHIDGIYTTIAGVNIGALGADCPIIICMGKGECAVIHSGWKGAKKHIIRYALELFSTPLENIQIFIGPHIGKDSYEVQRDFFEHFPNRFFQIKAGKSFFDIESFLIDDMLEAGIQKNQIHTHGADTYLDGKYYSYRRDGMVGVGCVSVEMVL